MIGTVLTDAARQQYPEQAVALAGALHWLRLQPFGRSLLGVVAVGLMAFGLAHIAKARYRRIRIG